MPEVTLHPNDTDAEEYVLGALINSPRDDMRILEISDTLKPGDFFMLRNQEIYKAILWAWKDNIWIDMRLIQARVEKTATFDTGDLKNFLLDICSKSVSAFHAGGHAKSIIEMSARRQVLMAASGAVSLAWDLTVEIDDVRQQSSDEMIKACSSNAADNGITSYAATEALYKNLEKGIKPGVLTGYRDIDSHFRSGLKPGSYLIIAGRPAMGKSAFALRIAQNAATGKTTPDGEPGVILYITLEMSAEDNLVRIHSEHLNMPINDVYDLTPDHERWGDYKKSCDKAGYLPIVYYESNNTITGINTAYTKCLMDFGRCDIVIIDRIELMDVGGVGAGADNKTLTIASASLLFLSKKVPVVCLAQLSRKVEERANKEPLLSDLRMSGSLEQDADVVFMLYREHYYDDSKDPNAATVFIRKNRQGSPGKAELYFKPELTAFYDMEW